jgi:cytochrome P450
VHAHVHGLIERSRVRMRARPADTPGNLLEALLAERDAPGSGIDDATVVANVITLLLAGEDTTAYSLAWCMPYLAADPALQDRLSVRTRALFGDARVCPNEAAVRALDAFEAVATEATRLKPVVPFFGLETTADIEFGGVAIPARTPLFFILRPDMVDAAHFGDPHSFDPSRWHREAAGAEGCSHAARAHDARAYVQFGAGPRVCPGRHLAAVEIRLVLSMLMRNFRLQLGCDPAEIREVLDFTMHPETMPIRLAARA